MRNIIPDALNQLTSIDQKIAEAKQQYEELLERKEHLTATIQEHCSHPAEYVKEVSDDPRGDRDPLAAETFTGKCCACGKELARYKKNQRGEREYLNRC